MQAHILRQITVPQFDNRVEPLVVAKEEQKQGMAFLSSDQLAKKNITNLQNDLLGGGKYKMDPRVY